MGLRTRALDPMLGIKSPKEPEAYVCAELDPPLHGWSIDAAFHLRDGVVVQGPVTFTPPAGLTHGAQLSAAARRLGFYELLEAFEDGIRMIEASVPGGAARGWVDALTAGRKPGRRGQDPAVYLLWAQRRVEAEHHAPKAPIKWMVEQWGDRYSEGAINKYVYMAREKGFLPAAGEPVTLTEQAKRLLKGAGHGKR